MDESSWIVKPHDARIEIAIGPEAKLTPEVRGALDTLLRVLEAHEEVRGYFNCADVAGPDCDSYFHCSGVTM
jgi:hypothetical protein